MNDFEQVWGRITALSGQTFHTKRGIPFAYDATSSSVALRNTERSLPVGHFKKALDRFPVSGPGDLQDLQGPSYLYAILTDPRVRESQVT
jgi:hypothetical protein